jgi:hypothetical protein
LRLSPPSFDTHGVIVSTIGVCDWIRGYGIECHAAGDDSICKISTGLDAARLHIRDAGRYLSCSRSMPNPIATGIPLLCKYNFGSWSLRVRMRARQDPSVSPRLGTPNVKNGVDTMIETRRPSYPDVLMLRKGLMGNAPKAACFVHRGYQNKILEIGRTSDHKAAPHCCAAHVP